MTFRQHRLSKTKEILTLFRRQRADGDVRVNAAAG
jgi:hypothetical protein